MPSSSSSLILSQTLVFPDRVSDIDSLKLSVSDLPMLSCHYIQKGCLFTRPNLPIDSLVSQLRLALSRTLSLFPPLAGRLVTDSDGYVYLNCNDAGVDFVHASATHVSIRDVLSPTHVPDCVRDFFSLDRTVSYDGHFKPILAVRVTELSDGLFIGCALNHAVTDGTSFWNFFNTFAEVCRVGARKVAKVPDFSRNSFLISPAVLQVPAGGPKVTFSVDAPISERIFSFSRESILMLKNKVNDRFGGDIDAVEILGKHSNDTWKMPDENNNTNSNTNNNNVRVTSILGGWIRNAVCKRENAVITAETVEISSFQSLCALLWRCVTRARKFPSSKMTTFRMAVNVRHRVDPKLNPYYFGNAIQSIPTYATAGDVLSKELKWCAEQLNKNVIAHDDSQVRRYVGDWESNPRCFPLGNFDGAMLTMGSSPRFPMYDNDFGWGWPMAVRSGKANKFDGKISAFPGREGGGSVDLEVVLSPETMMALESDPEFMQYVSGSSCNKKN